MAHEIIIYLRKIQWALAQRHQNLPHNVILGRGEAANIQSKLNHVSPPAKNYLCKPLYKAAVVKMELRKKQLH